MSERRRKRSTANRRSLWALGGIGLGFVSPLAAQGLEATVVVGKANVPATHVAHALEECAKHASEMTASACLDEYWVPRWLLDVESTKRKLHQSPGLQHLRNDILHEILVHELISETASPSDSDVDAYIAKHRRDFEKPLRLRVFRILVASEEDAQAILKRLSPSSTLADFRELAREHSLDRATNQRAGDLGFVWPNGSTDIPQVSADESLYEAALELEDGEIGSAPIPEGKHFAVIWRRGSLPAQEVDTSARQRAALLIREERTEQALQRLLRAQAKKVKGRDDALLSKLRRKEASLFSEP